MIEVPAELLSFIRSEEARAQDPTLDEQRAAGIDFYNGEPFGDEEDGRSQLVTRDVSEVIDFMTVSILGTMVSGDKVVEFETSEDEMEAEEPAQGGQGGQQQPSVKVDYGQQATEAVAYHFMRKQKGYRILHDALKAGLMEKTGVVKTYVEPQQPKREMLEVPDIALEQDEIGVLVGGMRVVEAEETQPGMMDETTGEQSPAMYRVVVEAPQAPQFRDDAVPNEEIYWSADATDLDEAALVGHKTRKTISDLVKMGYDPEELETIWVDLPADSIVTKARDRHRAGAEYTRGADAGAMRQAWFREEYVFWDFDGDGIAERLFIHRIGHHFLRVEPIDEQPFSLWSPFPMQHRIIGQSAADKTMDIQRTRSVLLRQAMDNIYQSNSPRVLVPLTATSDETIDDLLTVRPGALIRYKGGEAPSPFAVPFTADGAFQAMEMMTAERESRTGVTRHNQGMNPDTLNKTASGMAMLQAAGDQIELYVARNFAEFLVAPMFAKRYRLMRQHGQPFRMKIDGRLTEVDPRQWPEEIDMAINVGLGTGRKDQRVEYRMGLLGIQKEALAGGLRIVTEKQIYNNVKSMVADTALGNINDYMVDPDTLGPVPERPDPAMAEVQAKAQLEAQKQQAKEAEGAADIQLKQAESAARLQIMRDEAELKAQLERDRAAAEAALAERKFVFETGMAREQMLLNAQIARATAQMKAQAAPAIPKNRPGGELDE